MKRDGLAYGPGLHPGTSQHFPGIMLFIPFHDRIIVSIGIKILKFNKQRKRREEYREYMATGSYRLKGKIVNE
jgi:hypothetical protein